MNLFNKDVTPAREVTKRMFTDKEYREFRKAIMEEYKAYFFLNIIEGNTYKLESKVKENTYYIISPSNYLEGEFQVTTFIGNDPYCHTSHKTVTDLFKHYHVNWFTNKVYISENA